VLGQYKVFTEFVAAFQTGKQSQLEEVKAAREGLALPKIAWE
jgi:hypothetical protein